MSRRLVSRICLALMVCGLVLTPALSARPAQNQDNSSRALRQPTVVQGFLTTLWHATTDWVRLRPQAHATKGIVIVPVPYPPYYIIIVTSGGGAGVSVPPDGAP